MQEMLQQSWITGVLCSFMVVVYSITCVENVMDKGICKGRNHGDDSKASSKGGTGQSLLSVSTRPLATGTTDKRAQCKYTVEFNVFF